ncbi:MAG: ABC transporter ATP-binding protein, partial [Desulfosalsimonas sp.]
SLQVYEKKVFCPSPGQNRFPGQTDTRRLRALINSNTSRQRFNLVVGMKNVRVAYGSTVIFENINWQIRQGERWALSGPNGSGKSTLLSLINGDHPQAYANEIVLFDRRRGSGESIWEIKKKTGFMSPELFQYFPVRYTCARVVESGFYDTLGVLRQTRPQNRQKAEQWMEVLGLSGFADRYFSQLSAGNQRLCLLARALVKNPCLLLLDEPCQGLAPGQQRTFQQLTDTIAAISDLTLVYVTHQEQGLPSCIQNTLHLPGSPL